MQLEHRIIHEALYQWGNYESRQMTKSYYPSITPLHRFMTEGAPGKPVFSSTILHIGTPAEFLKIRQSVEKLPEQQKVVVFTKYVFKTDSDGFPLTDIMRASLLGITINSFHVNLHKARAAIQKHDS